MRTCSHENETLLRLGFFAALAWFLTGSGMAAPNVNATKDDNLAARLRKVARNTIIVANTGTTDAAVLFTDPDPAATSFVRVRVARNGTFGAIGNLQIGIAAPGFDRAATFPYAMSEGEGHNLFSTQLERSRRSFFQAPQTNSPTP